MGGVNLNVSKGTQSLDVHKSVLLPMTFQLSKINEECRKKKKNKLHQEKPKKKIQLRDKTWVKSQRKWSARMTVHSVTVMSQFLPFGKKWTAYFKLVSGHWNTKTKKKSSSIFKNSPCFFIYFFSVLWKSKKEKRTLGKIRPEWLWGIRWRVGPCRMRSITLRTNLQVWGVVTVVMFSLPDIFITC